MAGQTAEQLGDFERALDEYRAAVRADKEHPEAALAAARLYFALGEYEAAAEFAQMHAHFRPTPEPAAYLITVRAGERTGAVRPRAPADRGRRASRRGANGVRSPPRRSP